MSKRFLIRGCLGLCVAALALLAPGQAARGYVEVAYSLGRILAESTNVLVMQVETVDKQKNLIVYRKIRDLKGTHPGEQIKHDIGQRGFAPREWQNVMAWAEVGKTAVFFHQGGVGEVCIDNYWYQMYAGDWWAMSHAEPFFMRSARGPGCRRHRGRRPRRRRQARLLPLRPQQGGPASEQRRLVHRADAWSRRRRRPRRRLGRL
ncbi:MAG: hypothetical protein NTU94_15375 [Planctomycetota bacterium]|nr:hypothetical protein [Planctomycetota bacterium]